MIYIDTQIKYLSPIDLTEPNTFKEDSFDGCISTNTLEHISKEDLYKIFNHLKYIIKKNGLISAVIDYSDHYSHTDPSINSLHFLRYEKKDFKKYNHKNHFQNRPPTSRLLRIL